MADIKVEGHTHLIRDEESHAIINTDVENYRLTMKRRQILRTQRDEINSLKNDMSEKNDLSSTYPLIVKKLSNKMDEMLIEMDGKLPTINQNLN